MLFVINFVIQVFVLFIQFYVTNPLKNTFEKLIKLLTVLNLNLANNENNSIRKYSINR